MADKYSLYQQHMQKIADVNNAAAVLQWDQETYMPEKGADFRARQLATLSGISHDLSLSEELYNLAGELANDVSLNRIQQKNATLSLKDLKKKRKYSTDFVEKLSLTISQAFQAWQEAKHKSDFSIFQPSLEKLVELKKKECEILGYADHPYDALLDQYEPEAKTKDITTLFDDVRQQLVPFVKQIMSVPAPDDSFMHLEYDEEKQWNFSIRLLEVMGYDFSAGRQDRSSHPFTTCFSSRDVRVTTRINRNDLAEVIWSSIHEGGHALYEQGLDPEFYGLPAGEYCSLSIHESQSRLWENNVGRSKAFWRKFYPELQSLFSGNLSQVPLDRFYAAMNKVQPSLIRTSADELTYHFHVMIRFEIEKLLLEGSISVKDLPQLWNLKYKEYLGIDVPSDDKGVLQDVHWSHGSFGYFPTYSVGSFYAAQFFSKASEEIPNLHQEITDGRMAPLLTWLRKKIHRHGRLHSAEELCEQVTGERLNFRHFMDYARSKYAGLY